MIHSFFKNLFQVFLSHFCSVFSSRPSCQFWKTICPSVSDLWSTHWTQGHRAPARWAAVSTAAEGWVYLFRQHHPSMMTLHYTSAVISASSVHISVPSSHLSYKPARWDTLLLSGMVMQFCTESVSRQQFCRGLFIIWNINSSEER